MHSSAWCGSRSSWQWDTISYPKKMQDNWRNNRYMWWPPHRIFITLHGTLCGWMGTTWEISFVHVHMATSHWPLWVAIQQVLYRKYFLWREFSRPHIQARASLPTLVLHNLTWKRGDGSDVGILQAWGAVITGRVDYIHSCLVGVANRERG